MQQIYKSSVKKTIRKVGNFPQKALYHVLKDVVN